MEWLNKKSPIYNKMFIISFSQSKAKQKDCCLCQFDGRRRVGHFEWGTNPDGQR